MRSGHCSVCARACVCVCVCVCVRVCVCLCKYACAFSVCMLVVDTCLFHCCTLPLPSLQSLSTDKSHVQKLVTSMKEMFRFGEG